MSDDTDDIWQQEPVEIERRPNGRSVFTMRWDTPEFYDMLNDARQAGMSASAYIRECVRLRHQMPQLPQAGIVISTTYAVFANVPTWSEASRSEVTYERR